MTHQIHFWFDNAKFALKPLKETPEGVVVQWHWLKRSILKPLTYYIRPSDDILHQAGVMDQNWGGNFGTPGEWCEDPTLRYLKAKKMVKTARAETVKLKPGSEAPAP